MSWENVTNEARLNLVKRFTSTTPGRRFVLLQAAAIYAASVLLPRPEGLPTGSIRFPTIFLHGYVSNENLWQNAVQIAPLPGGMGEASVEYDEPETLHLDDLKCIEDWDFKTLDIKTKSSLWESKMTRLTRIMCAGENVQRIALQRASRALELDESNLRAWYHKAIFCVKGDWGAVNTLKEVTQRMEQAAESHPAWLDIGDRRSSLSDLYFQLEDRLWSIGKQRHFAFRCHIKCLKYHEQSYLTKRLCFSNTGQLKHGRPLRALLRSSPATINGQSRPI